MVKAPQEFEIKVKSLLGRANSEATIFQSRGMLAREHLLETLDVCKVLFL